MWQCEKFNLVCEIFNPDSLEKHVSKTYFTAVSSLNEHMWNQQILLLFTQIMITGEDYQLMKSHSSLLNTTLSPQNTFTIVHDL